MRCWKVNPMAEQRWIWLAILLPVLLLGVGGAAHAADAETGEQDDPWSETGSPDDDWGDDDWGDDGWGEEVSPWNFNGFVEGARSRRVRTNPALDEPAPLSEVRGQIEGEYEGETATWSAKVDGVADAVDNDAYHDVREAMVSFPVGSSTDVRMGRQVLTWGTGDLLFLNDLFPKDWTSFLIGRDDEYLKAPSDALRASWFGDLVNIDVAWLPEFRPDDFITGQRLGYFDPARGEVSAAPPRVRGTEPPRTLDNSELALRLYGMTGSTEWAFYAYRGFYGQPTELLDEDTGEMGFARLNSTGASLRAPLAGGIYNLETSWYDSVDNRDGDDRKLPNSELRVLAGYEREVVTDFTLAAQYYVEWLQDYDELRETWPGDPEYRPDEYRRVVTLRPTYQMMRGNLTLSMMSFYSPSDEDYFLRPTVDYRHTDNLRFSVGANVFGGEDRHTFYGQFEDDTSVFTRIRYSF